MQAQVQVQFNHCLLIVHHHHHHLLHLHFLVYYRKVEEGEEEKPGEPVGTIISAAKLLGVSNALVNTRLHYAFQFSAISSPEN